MAWSGKIIRVDTEMDNVVVTVQINCDAPPVEITRSFHFREADQVTAANVIKLAKAEILRIGDLYTAAADLQKQVGVEVRL